MARLLPILLPLLVVGSLIVSVQTAYAIPSTVTVTATPNPVVFGETETLQASVVCDALLPTGTASFFDGVVLLGVVPLAGGTATFTSSSFTVGAHSITVIYNGDINCDPAAGGTVMNVQKISTTTNLVSSLNPSGVGQAVTFTATVVPATTGGGTPDGSVDFVIDGGAPTSVVLSGGQATLTTSALSAGAHSIVATYSGSTNFSSSSGSLTQTVNQGSTTTSLVSSLNPSTVGQSVTFTITVAAVAPAPGTPTGTVVVLIDGSPAATVLLSGGTASVTTNTLAVGSHSVVADYSGDTGFTASSGSLSQIVNQHLTTTTISGAPNPSTAGQSVTMTAMVTSPTATVNAGNVAFLDGVTLLATVAVNGSGTATFTTNSLSPGAHAITANYAGTADFATSSGTYSQTVNATSTTTVLTALPNPSSFGQNVTFTATVTDGSLTVNAGSVTFMDGATTLASGVAVNASGQATFSTSALTAGPHTITASYGGTPSFAASSGSVVQTVNALLPVVATSSPAASITQTSAALGGNLTDAGGGTISARGIVLAQSSANPTPALGGAGVTTLADGSVSLGAFTESAAGLLPGTNYGFRAFATNQAGTSYGAVVTFTTQLTGGTFTPPIKGGAPPVQGPSLTKAFGSLALSVGGTTTLTFTVSNPNATPLTGVSFTDALPAGISITGAVSGICPSGVINTTASSVVLSGAALNPGQSCSFSVTVTALTAGTWTNTAAAIANGTGFGPAASASLTVGTPSAPSFKKGL